MPFERLDLSLLIYHKIFLYFTDRYQINEYKIFFELESISFIIFYF